MVGVRGDVLLPPRCTTPAAPKANEMKIEDKYIGSFPTAICPDRTAYKWKLS